MNIKDIENIDIKNIVDIKAPMSGKVISIDVTRGATVTVGQRLLVFEAMKMENELFAPNTGMVMMINVAPGTVYNAGDPLITIHKFD